MMKILLSLCLFASMTLSAQDNVMLDKIKKKNAAYNAIECAFTQEKTIAATNTKQHLAGTLYFERADKMAMHYTQPATDLLIINGTKFYMARGTRKNLFDTSKNAPMFSLSNTLLNCMMGTLTDLAKQNNADLATSKTAKYDVVTMTARKKAVRGYSKIMLWYDVKDSSLCMMQMDEFAGNSTLYTMVNKKTNGKIASDRFAVPKK